MGGFINKQKAFDDLLSKHGSLTAKKTQAELDTFSGYVPPTDADADTTLARMNKLGLDEYNSMINTTRDTNTVKESAVQSGRMQANFAAKASAEGAASDVKDVAVKEADSPETSRASTPSATPAGTFKRKVRSSAAYQAGVNI